MTGTAASLPNPLLSTAEVAAYLGIPLDTLYSWRQVGKGPRGYRVGKYVRYRQTDVDAWLERQADAGHAA